MLQGLKVVALEQAVAAPLCTRILADWGADVIKVERPPLGDFSRSWDAYVNGQSSYFVTLNRGKRSLLLDLKRKRGRQVLERLLDACDVFVHNFTARALRGLDLEPEVLTARHPQLVVCSIWGYGRTGPFRDRKAYDILVQGEAGIEATTGTLAEPARLGIPVADIGSGLYAAISVLAALHARGQDGQGRAVEVSLFSTMLDWLAQPLAQWANAGVGFERRGLFHHLLVPYGAYRTRDGLLVNIAIQQDVEWRSLCELVLERPDLAEDRSLATFQSRREHRAQVDDLVAAAVAELVAEELERRLDQAAIAHGRLRSVEDVAQHPQLDALGLLQQTSFGTIVGPVLTDTLAQRPPPALGQHGPEILSELGYDPVEAKELLS